MKFNKSLIDKRVYITGCGDDNICAKCNNCIPHIKEGKIFGIIDALGPINENEPETSKVIITVGTTRIHTNCKWCHLIEDDIPPNNTILDNIIEVLF